MSHTPARTAQSDPGRQRPPRPVSESVAVGRSTRCRGVGPRAASAPASEHAFPSRHKLLPIIVRNLWMVKEFRDVTTVPGTLRLGAGELAAAMKGNDVLTLARLCATAVNASSESSIRPTRVRRHLAAAGCPTTEIVPCQPPVHAVRHDAHAAGRWLDLHFDEALKERRDVVVEDRRQPLGRERPGVEPGGPPPCRLFPPRRIGFNLHRDGLPIGIVRPVGSRHCGGPAQRRAEAEVRAAAAVDEVVHRAGAAPLGVVPRGRACPRP